MLLGDTHDGLLCKACFSFNGEGERFDMFFRVMSQTLAAVQDGGWVGGGCVRI